MRLQELKLKLVNVYGCLINYSVRVGCVTAAFSIGCQRWNLILESFCELLAKRQHCCSGTWDIDIASRTTLMPDCCCLFGCCRDIKIQFLKDSNVARDEFDYKIAVWCVAVWCHLRGEVNGRSNGWWRYAAKWRWGIAPVTYWFKSLILCLFSVYNCCADCIKSVSGSWHLLIYIKYNINNNNNNIASIIHLSADSAQNAWSNEFLGYGILHCSGPQNRCVLRRWQRGALSFSAAIHGSAALTTPEDDF